MTNIHTGINLLYNIMVAKKSEVVTEEKVPEVKGIAYYEAVGRRKMQRHEYASMSSKMHPL